MANRSIYALVGIRPLHAALLCFCRAMVVPDQKSRCDTLVIEFPAKAMIYTTGPGFGPSGRPGFKPAICQYTRRPPKFRTDLAVALQARSHHWI